MTTTIHGTLESLRLSRGAGGRLLVTSIDTHHQSAANVYVLPGDTKARIELLEQLRADVGDALEQAQAELVDENLRSLTPESPRDLVVSGELDSRDPRYVPGPDEIARRRLHDLLTTTLGELEARRKAEGEAIVRAEARENAYFTRTQGWDPRGDGP